MGGCSRHSPGPSPVGQGWEAGLTSRHSWDEDPADHGDPGQLTQTTPETTAGAGIGQLLRAWVLGTLSFLLSHSPFYHGPGLRFPIWRAPEHPGYEEHGPIK